MTTSPYEKYPSFTQAKTCLTYSRFYGIPFGDHTAEKAAKALKTVSLTVSTENVIHAFRLLIKQGYFAHDEVDVFFEKTPGEFLLVLFNKEGRSHDWYEGFCDTVQNMYLAMLGWDKDIPHSDTTDTTD